MAHRRPAIGRPRAADGAATQRLFASMGAASHGMTIAHLPQERPINDTGGRMALIWECSIAAQIIPWRLFDG